MSDVTIESLQQELANEKNNSKGLYAQLEATKQMFNEMLNSNMQLRASAVLITQSNQELVVEKSKLMDEVATHKQHALALITKINDLTIPETETILDHCIEG